MRLAFVAYDGLTALDLVGGFDPLTRLGTMGFRDDVDWDLVGPAGSATATGGLTLDVDRVRPDLGAYDLVYVPGGHATRDLVDDAATVDWLASAADADLLVSVCTGALLLGAAGLLEGRRATTHPSAYDDLAAYCEVVEARVVDDGDLVTGGGVAAAVDLGLHVVGRLADDETREAIRTQMDYPYGEDLVAAGGD